MALRDVHKKYSVYERRAEVLQNYVVDKFSEEKIYQQFVDCALEGITIPDDTEIDEMYSELFG